MVVEVVSALRKGLFVSLVLATAALAASAAQFVPQTNTLFEVAPASNEGQLAIKKFRVTPGLKVDLWAAEPLLANPVAICTDEKGRWYVAETFRLHAGVTDIRGHMDWLDEELASQTVQERDAYMTRHEGKKIAEYYKYSDRVRLIVDTDGDGKADKATVFADGFKHLHDGIGAGVLARDGKVWYTCIPDLYLLQDTRGTGTADSRKSLQTGYGIRTGFLGHDLHGLRFGPDGKLYFSIGDRGFNVQNGGRTIKETEMGAVLRCNPDGSELEVYARGVRNPQELAFDQYGNLFTGDNNSDGGDPARWVYVVEGGDSGWRVGYQFINSPNSRGAWNSERLCYPQFEGQAAYIIPPVALIANGPSGLAYYPGTGLPEQYKEHFLLCDFRGGAGSGVHSFAVKPKGAGFEMIDRTHFVWEILCTDADFGIDGGLYISDWVEGWNKTGKGRIYRAHDPALDKDPQVLQTKSLIMQGMKQRPSAELAQLLGYPDMRVRQEAQFALAEKNASSELTAVLRANAPLARLHAIWGLGQLLRRNPAVARSLVPLLRDADPEVRAQAAKAIGDAHYAKAQPDLIRLLSDESPRVRFLSGMALSKVGDTSAIAPALAMLRANANHDVYLRHAGVMVLQSVLEREPGRLGQLQAAARDDSPAVRMAALLVMRRLHLPEIAQFLDDKEALIVVEAARAISDEPIVPALPKLAALINRASQIAAWSEGTIEAPGPRDPMLRRVVNANFRLGSPDAAVALASFSGNEALPVKFRAEALEMLGEWGKPSGRDRITGLWRPLPLRDRSIAARALAPGLAVLLRTDAAPIKIAAARAATELDLHDLATPLFGVVADGAQPATVRVEALKALYRLKDRHISDAVKVALAAPDESLRNEATKIQAQLRPKDATAQIRATLDKGSLREKQNALETLGAMGSSSADDILTQWLDRLIARRVAPELQLDVLAAAAKRKNPAIQERLKKYEASRDPKDELGPFRECLVGGDAKEGRTVFFEKAEASCIRCHKVSGEGGEVGPDLTGIGARKDRQYILESIVFPNKQIAQGFDSVLVTLKNETTYAGTLKNETDTLIEINSPEDGPVKVNKSDIKTRQRGLSAMPEEMRQILTKQELRNVVDFLATTAR